MTEQVTFAVGNGWPTPNNCRRVADALDAITPARYGDILRAYADAEDARFGLASSALVTASESATEGCGQCGTTRPCTVDGAVGAVGCAQLDTPRGVGVTSSDGDRGLSEEELEILHDAIQIGWEFEHDLVPAVERILAARTAQSEGVERVEWGVRVSGDHAVFAISDERSWSANWARASSERTLVRRTVTTYAPVTGPWEVVGDE